MAHTYFGACDCGQVELSLVLANTIDRYQTRACDCDFCAEHDLVYLSDPLAKLHINSMISLFHKRQGSQQAEFLCCVNCETVVAVSVTIDNVLRGAINAECLNDMDVLSEPELVSPKELSANEKLERWKTLWGSIELSEPD
ncbi:aldehyde-activating protein [Ningiella sp. W23]|uniref:aldehyde-activating protein n=1 Tax=Ningiella sp. W23 TaxID=3023715 RepID=UPI003756527E